MVGRNDDYMPDFADRVRIAIEWNVRHLVEEVIFVEWNPPEGRPWLSTELARNFPEVRGYVVPTEIHTAIARNPSLPLMEYHAKNVGIRRAKTDWVIAGNAGSRTGRPSPRSGWISSGEREDGNGLDGGIAFGSSDGSNGRRMAREIS
jgi:hypothetical protein